MRSFALFSALGAVASVSATSTIMFNSPRELVNLYEDGVENSQAMFGIPSYGGHAQAIIGRLIYANQDDQDACNDFSQADKDSWNITDDEPIILMADRGTCHFVMKVRHAQNAGARAAIIVDNQDNPVLPLMADDLTGGDIAIPSVLIHMNDGAQISPYMAEMPMVTMQWNLPNPDGRVEWDFWTSSDDTSSALFKHQFDKATKSLGIAAKLTPHYFFMGVYYGCLDNPEPECLSSCINNGRYCADDPERDINMGLSGKVVVEENLRQMCLWETHIDDDEDPQDWFDYVTMFLDQCNTPETWNKNCSDTIINTLGLDAALVGECVTNATADASGEIPMIEDEISLQRSNGVYFKPTVTVNNMMYEGSLSCPDPIDRTTCGVLSEICAGFADGTAPETCEVTDCPLGEKRDPCNVCGGHGKVDACGKCFESEDSPGFNTECVKGCDGVINSGKVVEDVCKRCGLSPDACGTCYLTDDPARVPDKSGCAADGTAPKPPTGIAVWLIVVIVLVVIVTVGAVVYVAMTRREARQRADIDELLAQYLPMDKERAESTTS